MDLQLNGSTIVITGGGSGIGFSIAELAIAEGARVAVIDARQAALEQAMERLRFAGGDVAGEVVDVRDATAMGRAVEMFEDRLGPIMAGVACAGISRPSPALELSLDLWREVIDVNLTGTFVTLQALASRMSRSGGALVALSSVAGLGGNRDRASYVASKAGVIGLIKSLAIEWGEMDIRVNSVAPGAVDSPMIRGLPPEHREALAGVVLERTPLGRFATAEDVARAVLFLCSPVSRHITGTVVTVDGGFSAGGFTTRRRDAGMGEEKENIE